MTRSEFSAFAPAKINLYLHVGPAEASGYHPISSLAVFADVGDRLDLAPAEAFEFLIDGPGAAGLAADDDNLVLKAMRALERAAGARFGPLRLLLHKTLPVAAGLGGGSADAGAALKLLRAVFDLALSDDDLAAIAEGLGADGPLCLHARPAIAEGRGERLSPAPELPELHAVLVNPGVACPTAAVYQAYDAAGAPGSSDRPSLPQAFESTEELAAVLAQARNDLEPPAIALQPMIGEVLARLRDAPQTLFARMSGSGATCFALVAGEMEARSLAESLSVERPGWWVRPCRLGGPWAD
jgi:4-diphosphocytidyl-2-C-methyl-D-erythritol kinase